MMKKMKYRYLNKKEIEAAIIHILEVLLDDSIPYSGKHRKQQWEKGWKENLESGNGVPKYFGKYPVCRLNGRLIKVDKNWEIEQLHHLVHGLTKKYFSRLDYIFEFGCGIGHNLVAIRDYLKVANPNATLCGLDWTKSGVDFVKAMGFKGSVFDFFEPDYNFGCKDSGILTVASLEQTGKNFKPFVKYLLKQKPKVVVHIEPIPELLDSRKLLDYLSIKYMKKRKYLDGYLDYLEKLEKDGKIEILEARRSGIGSMMIDGYSIICWKPKR